MNNLQRIIAGNTRAAMHMAVELCEQGDFDSVTEAFRWLNQETVGNYTRWHELFGTPERAARTLESMSLDSSIWCRYDAEGQLACKACPYEFDPYGCCDLMPLLEWLRGDA